jgi:hypothetical protein
LGIARCGIQWQRTSGHLFDVWPEKEIMPPGIALVTGIAVHDGVERNMMAKKEGGKPADRKMIQQWTADRFDKESAAPLMLSEDEALHVGKSLGKAKDMAVVLVTLHYDQVAPKITPTEVEWKWVVDLPNYPFDLAGRVDIVAGNTIRDTKTNKYRPNIYSPQTLQFKTYCMARKVVTGTRPTKCHADYLVKTAWPKAMTESCKPVAAWDDDVMARIDAATKLIEAVRAGHQAFAPAHPDAWWCASTYCGFAFKGKGGCPYWSGRK